LLKPGNKKINWFQGINPEEAVMIYKNKLRAFIWEIYERITLKNAVLNLFVSKAMQSHYNNKYGYNGDNYLIMPCYNAYLNPAAFLDKDKYTNPKFVYSGSLSTWQCINKVLEIFKHVQSLIPDASLMILTAAQTKARLMIKQHQLNNCDVAYIPSDQIGDELKKYKYGFLIREDHMVNTVSTPTKMNTYLANGIIPVFSDVVADFKDKIALYEYELRLSTTLHSKEIAQIIYDFEANVRVEPTRYMAYCQTIFDTYYNDKIYTEPLGMIFKNLSLKL